MYTFPDAFMLMWYACRCGHRERIWNNRDGVVPVGMGCPSCGQASLRHVEWARDLQDPAYVPYPGQGIWRDGTPEEAQRIMGQRLDKCVGTPYEVDAARRAQLLDIVASGSESEFHRGWPMFDRVS